MAAIATFLALLVVAPAALASVVSVSIRGNNVTYSASGLDPDTDVTVTIEDAANSSQQSTTTSSTGNIPPSTGTTGGPIAGGSMVTVTVVDAETGKVVGQGSATKPRSGIIDTLAWLVRWLI